ncbi:MAG: cobaltochelatase subunit CobN [Burkholderiaceae bacterium]
MERARSSTGSAPRRRARLVAAALMLAAVAAAWLGWREWLAPTRVALVNYPEFQAARIIKARPGAFVRVEVLPPAQLARARRHDLVLVFGRGLRLDDAQAAQLRDAGRSGTPVFVDGATNPEHDALTSVQGDEREAIAGYLRGGGPLNYARLQTYARRVLDRKPLFAGPVEPPQPMPQDVFFHLDDEAVFADFAAFEQWLRARPGWQPGRPRLALLTSVPGPFNANRDHVDAVIRSLEARGFEVVPISAMRKRLAFLQQVDPVAVVYMPHGRLAPGQADDAAQWLRARNIPLFAPVSVFAEAGQWRSDQRSFDGGLLTMSVTLPEIDGATAPMAIAAQFRDDDGLRVFRALPAQLERFADLVQRTVALGRKADADKKLAIYYYKGPGQSALTAGDLEVVPSLYALLRHLRDAGYRVDGLPATEAEFAGLLQRRGPNIGPYANGDFAGFLRDADPAWVPASQLNDWCGKAIAQALCDQVARQFGPAPGRYLSAQGRVAVARVPLGNVVLLPQPLPGLGDDTFKLVHGTRLAPPWPYVASYLWTRQVFGADAVMHFGTHGSLEFTPYKQVALSDTDWPDALIAGIPHVYLYTMSNIGEAMIAKRRSYATIVSHLTPPLREGGAPADGRQLAERLRAWEAAGDPALKRQYAQDIQRQAIALGLHRDLSFDPGPAAWGDEQLARLAEHMETIEHARITVGLYTLGRPYAPQAAETTARLIGPDTARYRGLLAESPARELAALDNALAGGFTPPSSGGDPLLNPAALPTGRNLYAIDAEKTPSDQAWAVGRRLADQLLAQHRAAHQGAWPDKIAFTLWAGDFIHTEGTSIAQILYLLGVEPVRDPAGRLSGLRLIPREELGRPRIDVVVQASGQLRDLAASRLALINQAVALAATADEPDNAVARGVQSVERRLKEGGASPADARRFSAVRVFGGVNGQYGTGIMGMVEAGDRWSDRAEVARTYLTNMGAAFGEGDLWGAFQPGAFEAALAGTQVVVQPLSSNTWGPISLDHVYEFMGGLNLAVRESTGQEPAAYFSDTRDASRPTMREAGAAIAVDARATVLNPAYIEALTRGGASSAEVFAESFRNLYGWNVTKPSAIPSELWDALDETYVRDARGLGVRDFFERANPYALQEMTAVMLETARKGYWRPDPSRLRDLARLHAELVARFGASGTEFVNDNRALRGFIAERLAPDSRQAYDEALRDANEGPAVATDKATVLRKIDDSPSAANGGAGRTDTRAPVNDGAERTDAPRPAATDGPAARHSGSGPAAPMVLAGALLVLAALVWWLRRRG